MLYIKLACILVVLNIANAINWQGNWAMDCDFAGNDLSSVPSPGELCSLRCAETQGCTHFTWVNINNGICYLKSGPIGKQNALSAPGKVCGVNPNGGAVNPGTGGNPGTGPVGDAGPLTKGALIFADEFDSPASYANWHQEVNGNGGGNNEKQFYTNTNTFIKDSILTIQARKEQYNGKQYTSGRLTTNRRFRYGIFEMRAKLPRGRGTWPAFWTLAIENINWPASGELDIMEHVGYDHGRIHGTVHTARFNHKIGTQVGKSIFIPDVSEAYHLYQMEWTPNRIRCFVDNREYFRFDKQGDSNDVWPFDREHIIILNLAIGGDWGGQKGIDDSVFPANYDIDYVRVYSLP